jgi:hypothetical protein
MSTRSNVPPPPPPRYCTQPPTPPSSLQATTVFLYPNAWLDQQCMHIIPGSLVVQRFREGCFNLAASCALSHVDCIAPPPCLTTLPPPFQPPLVKLGFCNSHTHACCQPPVLLQPPTSTPPPPPFRPLHLIYPLCCRKKCECPHTRRWR